MSSGDKNRKQTPSQLVDENLAEDDKPTQMVEQAYQGRIVALRGPQGSRIIATAIRRRIQVGSGRNYVKRQGRFHQKKKGDPESLQKADLKVKSELVRTCSLPSSPSTSTFAEQLLSPSSSKPKPKEIETKVASPKSPNPTLTSTPERKPKTDGGSSDRWLRSKSNKREMEVSFDLDLLTRRRRRTPREMKKLRESVGSSSDSESKSLDVPFPKPPSPVPATPVATDAETPTSAPDSPKKSIDGDKSPGLDQSVSELEAEVNVEVEEDTDDDEEDDEPQPSACSIKAWPKHFPFTPNLKPLPFSGGLTPSKILQYSATFDMDNKARKRVRELEYEGLWPAARLPKVYELPRVKDHWDCVLEEMTWMAEDFVGERRWKLSAAKQIAHSARQFRIQKKLKKKERRASPIKQEVGFGIDLDSCPIEDFLTYSMKDGCPGHPWMGKREGHEDEKEMPFIIFEPPVPSPDGSIELHIDFTLGYLYNYTIMSESELPSVYIPKKTIDVNYDPKAATLHPVPSPRYLFAETTLSMLELRKRLLAQRACRPLAPWKAAILPLSLVRSSSVPLQQQIIPSFQKWLVEEDATLLDTVRNGFQLQRSQFPILPAHTMNWTFMADKGKLMGMSHKSPKQCLERYENVVKIQADQNLSTNFSKSTSVSFPQGIGNVEFDTVLCAKLKAMKAIRAKKQKVVPPPGKGFKLNPDRNKVPIEDLLRSKYNIEYVKPVEVKGIEFLRKKEGNLETQQQQISTSGKTVALTSEPEPIRSSGAGESSSAATILVSQPPIPTAESVPINIDVSYSSKPCTSNNKVEIKPCEPLTKESNVKTNVTSPPTSLSKPKMTADSLSVAPMAALPTNVTIINANAPVVTSQLVASPISLPVLLAKPAVTPGQNAIRPVHFRLAGSNAIRPVNFRLAGSNAIRPVNFRLAGSNAIRPVNFRLAGSNAIRPVNFRLAGSNDIRPVNFRLAGSNDIRPVHFRLAGSNAQIVLLQAPLAVPSTSNAGALRQTVSHLRFPPGFIEQLRSRYGTSMVQICLRPPTSTTGAPQEPISKLGQLDSQD